jgi:hypothetical protein
MMSSARFGIIRILPDGIPQCIEEVGGLSETKERVMHLASREPGEFFIYSEQSGIVVERFICVESENPRDREAVEASPRRPVHAFLS